MLESSGRLVGRQQQLKKSLHCTWSLPAFGPRYVHTQDLQRALAIVIAGMSIGVSMSQSST